MLQQLHQAAQYLSAFGICYVDKREDDSHTNLGWEMDHRRLITHASGQEQLALHFEDFALQWIRNGEVVSSFGLHYKTHRSAFDWIDEQRNQAGLSDYNYTFHYELPYDVIRRDSVYMIANPSQLGILANRLTKLQPIFKEFLVSNGLESPVRVWSHHFDLGLYTKVSEKLSIGAGLAIPDTLENEFYVYVTGWGSDGGIATNSFPELSVGQWHTHWKGATLTSDNHESDSIQAFLQEALEQFKRT